MFATSGSNQSILPLSSPALLSPIVTHTKTDNPGPVITSSSRLDLENLASVAAQLPQLGPSDTMFNVDFIQEHPGIFLTHDWVHLDTLRNFLHDEGHERYINDTSEVQVKQESVEDKDMMNLRAPEELKAEESNQSQINVTDDNEELKVSSSSQDGSFNWDPGYLEYQMDPKANLDDEDEMSCCSSPTAVESTINGGMTSGEDDDDTNVCPVVEEVEESDGKIASVVSSEAEDVEWKELGTSWLDKDISSMVQEQKTQVNWVTWVDWVEKVLGGIPSNWLISKVLTAYLIDLSNSKYLQDGKEVELDELLEGKTSFQALTVTQIYYDKKDMITYKCIFDSLQELVLLLTGQKLLFKALHPAGNLLTFGSDMELAELQAKVAESWANTKELTEKLREATGSKPKTQKHNAESSSCGHATPIQESQAQVHEGANPYPTHAGSVPRLPSLGPEYAPEVLSAKPIPMSTKNQLFYQADAMQFLSNVSPTFGLDSNSATFFNQPFDTNFLYGGTIENFNLNSTNHNLDDIYSDFNFDNSRLNNSGNYY
ncbi:hypothetical protein GYMLUDRAFT_239086 [Collybiopsis luxurians FD-317 M1]|nr:hypothetical protein GYMLUDRAFT_239086 [Collybiopsis luxurians FD-317 M1]